MTKAEKRAAAIAQLDASLKGNNPEPPKEAIITLIGDLLDSFDRIATALEKIAASPAVSKAAAP